MKNFWLTPFFSSFIWRRGTAPIVGVNLRWRILVTAVWQMKKFLALLSRFFWCTNLPLPPLYQEGIFIEDKVFPLDKGGGRTTEYSVGAAGGFVYSSLINEKFWLVPFLLNYYLLSLSSICLTKQNHGRNYRKIKINIEKI